MPARRSIQFTGRQTRSGTPRKRREPMLRWDPVKRPLSVIIGGRLRSSTVVSSNRLVRFVDSAGATWQRIKPAHIGRALPLHGARAIRQEKLIKMDSCVLCGASARRHASELSAPESQARFVRVHCRSCGNYHFQTNVRLDGLKDSDRERARAFVRSLLLLREEAVIAWRGGLQLSRFTVPEPGASA